MTDTAHQPLPISLRPVDASNWQYCISLQLAPEQASFLASNVYSLAEAYIQPRCTPRAIYAGEFVMGFVMSEYLEWRGFYSVARFMIDYRWQGYGYGSRALEAVVDTLKTERPDAPILISITPDNKTARRLYERQGFIATGERVHGEDVLRYP